MESALYGITHFSFCIRNLTRSISDTSTTRAYIAYARASQEVFRIMSNQEGLAEIFSRS